MDTKRLSEQEEVAAADNLYLAICKMLDAFFKEHGSTGQTQRVAVEVFLGGLDAILCRVATDHQEAACQFALDSLKERVAEILATDEELAADWARSRRSLFRIVKDED